MIITNNLKLPAPFVNMAQRDYIYEPNEYRVTSLLKGVRETILERRHDAEIERDVSDMVWLFSARQYTVSSKTRGGRQRAQRAAYQNPVRRLCPQVSSTLQTRQRPSPITRPPRFGKSFSATLRIGAGSS